MTRDHPFGTLQQGLNQAGVASDSLQVDDLETRLLGQCTVRAQRDGLPDATGADQDDVLGPNSTHGRNVVQPQAQSVQHLVATSQDRR